MVNTKQPTHPLAALLSFALRTHLLSLFCSFNRYVPPIAQNLLEPYPQPSPSQNQVILFSGSANFFSPSRLWYGSPSSFYYYFHAPLERPIYITNNNEESHSFFLSNILSVNKKKHDVSSCELELTPLPHPFPRSALSDHVTRDQGRVSLYRHGESLAHVLTGAGTR